MNIHFSTAWLAIATQIVSAVYRPPLPDDWSPEEHWQLGELNCAQGFREFSSRTQKETYYVGVYAPAGVETAYQEFNQTFETYLNEAVGKRFEPNIQFKMKASEDPLRDWIDNDEEIDFMYTDPGVFSCMGIEIGAQALATTIARLSSRGLGFNTDEFAGSMVALNSNKEINTVLDLKGKVIGAQDFSDFGGAQAQFYTMKQHGVDFIVDPKEVIFTGNVQDTIQGVLDGKWDVGFVRTGVIERTIDPATGKIIDPHKIKIIQPQIHVNDDGSIFPFLHSTPAFPEWPLSAKSSVDRIVAEEVALAMINFWYHDLVGEAIHLCQEEAETAEALQLCNTMPPVYFDSAARCDTTRELAELTHQAGRAGHHRGFRPPRSHAFVRTMQQDEGFFIKDEYGEWHCERADSLYDGIHCPVGFYKVPKKTFDRQCELSGTPCPEGYNCYCKPCVQASDVAVFPWHDDGSDNEFDVTSDFGCFKMDVCGSFEQTREIMYHMYDNRHRNNSTVLALLHLGDEERVLPVRQIEPYLYEFSFTHNTRGTAILELSFDGVQIPESPVQVEIIARDCEKEYPGQGRIPNKFGVCECHADAIAVNDRCIGGDIAEVSVSPLSDDFNHTERASDWIQHGGCEKMSLCGVVEQTKEMIIRAVDNRHRPNATVAAIMHVGHEARSLPVHTIAPYLYEFSFSDMRRGVAILELYVDGFQIPESPLRIQVIEKDCDEEFPNRGMAPDDVGVCICAEGTIHIAGQCMASGTFAAIVASVALLVVFQLGGCYLSYKRRKNDEIWQVNHEELDFDHPVQIVGQGAFGVVILADYRGTRVAIKRVLPLDAKARIGNSNSAAARSDSKASADIESGATPKTNSGINDNKIEGDSSFDSFDLDTGAPKTTLARWIPSFGSNRTSTNLTILNMSTTGGSTTRALVARVLPWCDKNHRRHEEFVKEMRLLSRLRHPCITTVMGAVMSGRDPMMVMEYMENGSLYDLLRNDTAYTGGEIIMQIVKDIAQGLRFLHASKPPTLHRDLKAKNILIDSRFRAKVADFGLSTKSSNALSGTPFWMAPEYLSGKKKYSSACDVYSFGMIIYEIYSRKIPYEGANPTKVLRKVCNPRINYRPRIPVTCPKRMADIMKKCWSPNPSFRPESKDLDMMFNDMNSNDAEPLIDEGNTRLRTEVAAGDMLYKVFPKKVADQLKAGQKVEPETHSNVTVFFSDIVRFTDISRAMSAVKVCNMLDRLYMAFDSLADKHEVFKLETIGDAWVGVTNLDGNQNGTHVKRIAEFAIDAVVAASQVQIDEDDPSAGCVHIRVGFHSGSVVSNVIGSLNPRFGLFGDTMNTASRMESLSVSGQVQCSEVSARLLKEQAPDFPIRKRGKVAVKGKGSMTTFWIGDPAARGSGLGGSSDSQRSLKSIPKGGFDDKPTVKFVSPSADKPVQKRVRISRIGKKKGAATKVEMDGSLRSALKDASDSVPMNWKHYGKNKNKGRLEMKFWTSTSLSQ
ncbi:unnamed protein product [Cylindrotheca closterium]|uniref:guanylate cyclase n=1 Tax=Cylindrotheca closterium TaxID=2856 RepID=A0AAD2CK35_9STRA|nr:unnamed protein product [Cylindrotheca closterium]